MAIAKPRQAAKDFQFDPGRRIVVVKRLSLTAVENLIGFRKEALPQVYALMAYDLITLLRQAVVALE